MSRKNAQSAPVLMVATACVLLTLLLWWPIPFYPNNNHNYNNSSAPAFSLLVTLTFDTDQSKQEFMALFAPLAEYVATHEPNTLAYQVLESDQNPLQILLLERYADKQRDYLDTHKSSTAFSDFRAKLAVMQETKQVVLSGQSYVDGSVGYIKK